MSYTISMDRAGRIVIPKAVRARLGADETTVFNLDVVLDRIEISPRDQGGNKARIVRKSGMWVIPSTGKEFSAAEAVLQDREDRADALSSRTTS